MSIFKLFNSYKGLIIFLFALSFIGCRVISTDDINIDEPIKIVLSSPMKASIVDTNYFKFARRINFETNKASLFKKVDRVFYNNDKYFVYDKSLGKVVIFDSMGKYVNHIQKIGRGPSEYIQTSDCFVDAENKQILVLCTIPEKIMYFNYNGEFLKEDKVNDLYLEFVASNGYFYCLKPEEENNIPNNYSLDILNEKHEVIQSAVPIEKDGIKKWHTPGLSLNKGASTFFSHRFDYNIYELIDDRISTKYSIDFGKHNLPSTLLRDNIKGEEFSEIIQKNKYVQSIYDVQEIGNLLIFQTNIGLFIYNKKDQLLNGFRALMNLDINASISKLVPMGTNEIAFLQNPSMVKVVEKVIIGQSKTLNNPNKRFLDYAATINADDNPILFIYTLKDI